MNVYISVGSNEMDTYCDYALFSIVSIFVFQASALEIGILGACYALPFLLLSPSYGRYFDSHNVKPLRAALFLACALSTPFILLSESIYSIYSIVLFKVSMRSGLSTSTPKLNEDDNESERFYEISGYLVNLSRVIVPLLVIYIYQTLGLSYVVMLSVLFSIIGFLSSVIDRNKNNNSLNINKENKEVKKTTTNVKEIIYENRLLLMLISAYIVSSISFYLSNDMLSVFFRFIGESETSVGYIITILGLGGIVGTKIAKLKLETTNVANVYSASILVNAIAFSIFGFTDSSEVSSSLYYLSIFITGIASGVSFVSMKLGIRREVNFSKLALVTGEIQKIAAIVAIILPLIGGSVAEMFTIQTPFMVTGVMMLLVWLYLINGAKKLPPNQQ